MIIDVVDLFQLYRYMYVMFEVTFVYNDIIFLISVIWEMYEMLNNR